MTRAAIIAMILSIATEYNLPPYFVLSVALTENAELNPMAISKQNSNGSFDKGIMQLSSSWFTGDWADPETNIREGCRLLKEIMRRPDVVTFWTVAVCYNAGCKWLALGEKPPDSSLKYADRVMLRWDELDKRKAQVLVRK